MIILAQDNRTILDSDKSLSIYAKDNAVCALNYTGELTVTLGMYANKDRAREVIEEIFTYEGSQDKYEMPLV